MCFIDYNFFPILFFLGWNILTAKQFTPNVSQIERKLPISFISSSSSFIEKWDKTSPVISDYSSYQQANGSSKADQALALGSLERENQIPDWAKRKSYLFSKEEESKLDRIRTAFRPLSALDLLRYPRRTARLKQGSSSFYSPISAPFNSPNTIPFQQGGKLIQRMNDRVHFHYSLFGPCVSKSFYGLSRWMCLPLQQKSFLSEAQTSVSPSSLLPTRVYTESKHQTANHRFWPIRLNDWAMARLLKRNTRLSSQATGYNPAVYTRVSNKVSSLLPIKGNRDKNRTIKNLRIERDTRIKRLASDNSFTNANWKVDFQSDLFNRTRRPERSVIFSSQHKGLPFSFHFIFQHLGVAELRVLNGKFSKDHLPVGNSAEIKYGGAERPSIFHFAKQKWVNRPIFVSADSLGMLPIKNRSDQANFNSKIMSMLPSFIRKNGRWFVFSIKNTSNLRKIQKRRSKTRFLLRTPIQKIYSLNKFQIPLCFSKILQLDKISNLNTLPDYTLDLRKNGSDIASQQNSFYPKQTDTVEPFNPDRLDMFSDSNNSLFESEPLSLGSEATGMSFLSSSSDLKREIPISNRSDYGEIAECVPSVLGTHSQKLRRYTPTQLFALLDPTYTNLHRKDLWYMKTQFFRHIGWNMKHQILSTSLLEKKDGQDRFHPRVISGASSRINSAPSSSSRESDKMKFNSDINIYGGSWYYESYQTNKKPKGTTEINGPGQFSFPGGVPSWYGVSRYQSGFTPDIGIYSLAHKLASLGLHGGNSDIDIYPFKYNDYYRYNFQNMNLRSFSSVAHNEKENGRGLITDFLYLRGGQERKFLDFENPIFSRIYAPLFQPQGVVGKDLNLLSFISDRITPSVNPNLKDSADSSIVPHVFLSLMNRFPSTQTGSFWGKGWKRKTLPFSGPLFKRKKQMVGSDHNKPISGIHRPSESKIFDGLPEKLPIKGLHTNLYPCITQNAHDRWLDSARVEIMSRSSWTPDSSLTRVAADFHSEPLPIEKKGLNTKIGTQRNDRFGPESTCLTLLPLRTSSQGPITYKQLSIKKPSIFFSSFRQLPYFLIAQNTNTNPFEKADSSVLSERVNRPIIDHSESTFSNQSPPTLQNRRDNTSTLSETADWSRSPQVSGSRLPYKKPFNLIHKFFTIKPLSAFTKKETGYQVSLPESRLLNRSLPVSPIKTNAEKVGKEEAITRSTDQFSGGELARSYYRPEDRLSSDRSEYAVYPNHGTNTTFVRPNLWKIFPPLFQHLTFRFVDLNLPRTWSSDIITKNRKVDDVTGRPFASDHRVLPRWSGSSSTPAVTSRINKDRQDEKTDFTGSHFRGKKIKHPSSEPSETMRWNEEIKQKKMDSSRAFSGCNPVPLGIQKDFFRFPLPFYFSDFFQSPPSPEIERQTGHNSINNGLYTMGSDHGLVFAQPIMDFRRRLAGGITGTVSRVSSTPFSNRNPSDRNEFHSSQLLTNTVTKGNPTRSKRSTGDAIMQPNRVAGSAVINLKYEGMDIDPVLPDSSLFRETPITKDQGLDTDWLEPRESYANQDAAYLDGPDETKYNPTGFKIQVYGEKPLLKNRTPHGPGGSGRNQKESISLPNYLKNITNQNYQNLYQYPREAAGNPDEGVGRIDFMGVHSQATVMVFWILLNKTLFIYLSLHYLQKFITFLGTEYIRNLFKIFVTMKFIDGNILSIIKTFQDFNFQLNQQNIIDIKVNKQLKTIKRN